jgi:hypothetical protein
MSPWKLERIILRAFIEMHATFESVQSDAVNRQTRLRFLGFAMC